ncbi:DUF7010 family protein [Qipengyuania nanhaisediminis]|uniref:DUF7010 family protein n=1 Tax=Qipengyuania nanhaisediminis TaxID=604088 RepID=UPI0038B3E2E9
MLISDAQADLRRAYTDGGPGVLISGLVWLAAWIADSRSGTATGFAVLFVGGMTIYPLALLANRALLRRPAEVKGNPGGPLVVEVTAAMIAGLFAAYLFLDHAPELVMPLAAIAVGVHYFAFRTAYGDKIFWALGAIVTFVGVAAIYRFVPLPGPVTLQVAIIEILFGIGLTWRGTRR